MQPAPKTASQLVTQAKQRIENLTPDQVAAELERGDVLLVDLREGEERAQKGVIPGAVHAPRGMLEFYAHATNEDHLPEFDPSRRTIVYCAGGARSALAVETLRQLGYTSNRDDSSPVSKQNPSAVAVGAPHVPRAARVRRPLLHPRFAPFTPHSERTRPGVRR